MFFYSFLAIVILPIRFLDRRIPFIEKLIRLHIGKTEFEAVRLACTYCRATFGTYYYWYAIKLIVSQHLRSLDKRSTLAMVRKMDNTDYSFLDAFCDHSKGLLVATPHHGHYILSIVALAERLRTSREVLIFYGAPLTHPGNEIFDHLYTQLFGNPSSGVRIIHDNRAGISRALRGLKAGAVVLIMPDVYKNEDDTYVIPFCGRPLNVMFGTAALARKTQSEILPMVSLPAETGLGFKSVFGPTVVDDAGTPPAQDEIEDVDTAHADYRVTLEMFTYFESIMAMSIVHWQYVRSHFMRQAGFPEITPASARQIDDFISIDPRFKIDLSGLIKLD